MKRFRSLKGFLGAEVRQCSYVYRPSRSRHLRVLFGNALHKAYAEALIQRFKAIHDRIVKELMIEAIPSSEWKRMSKRISRLVKEIKPKEKFDIKAIFELNDAYELSIVVETYIS